VWPALPHSEFCSYGKLFLVVREMPSDLTNNRCRRAWQTLAHFRHCPFFFSFSIEATCGSTQGRNFWTGNSIDCASRKQIAGANCRDFSFSPAASVSADVNSCCPDGRIQIGNRGQNDARDRIPRKEPQHLDTLDAPDTFVPRLRDPTLRSRRNASRGSSMNVVDWRNLAHQCPCPIRLGSRVLFSARSKSLE